MGQEMAPWASAVARTRIAEVAEGLDGVPPERVTETVRAALRVHARRFDTEGIVLYAGTNVMSETASSVSEPLVSGRPSMGPPGEEYQSGLDALDTLEVLAPFLVARLNRSPLAFARRSPPAEPLALPHSLEGMSQVIVFDLYGVIARTQTDAAKRRIEELAGVSGAPFWDAYWACRPAYDAGQEGAAYWAAVGDRLGTRLPDVPALIEADLDSWCDVDEEMVDLVSALADRGRTLGLLSNIIGDLIPRFEARHGGWLGRFDTRTYSCEIGVAKPDPEAYRICCDRLGVAPSDALFFDDTERNVRAARELGMRAEVFTSPAQVRALLAA